MTTPVRTLFFGSGSVALPALQALHRSPLVQVSAVVTAPPRPAGRKGMLTQTLVADAAAAADLDVRTPGTLRDEATQAELRAVRADLIVLADYGRIIPESVLDMPRHGALNIHPSLLPRHRGAAPVPAAIIDGDGRTGVTVMRMDAGLDTGPIVAQREVRLDGTELAPELEERLARLGAGLLLAVLPAWLEGSLPARPQPDAGVSLTRTLRREDGRLDPASSAERLERQVRAYQPWPGSFIDRDGARLKVWRAAVIDNPGPAAPGELVPVAGTLALVTSDGALRLDEVQPAGKRRMTGVEYLRGRRP